jgi:hypothetical protein
MNITTDFQTFEAKSLATLPWKWDTREALIDEVWSGLLKRPRSLVPWMLYDSEGSRLFECITTLPELSHANGAGHFGELCRSDYHGDWF